MLLILRCGTFEVPLETQRYVPSPCNVARLTFWTPCPSTEASPQFSPLFRGSFLFVLFGLHQTHTVRFSQGLEESSRADLGILEVFFFLGFPPQFCTTSDNPKLLLWLLRPARLQLSVWIPAVKWHRDWGWYLGEKLDELGSHSVWFSPCKSLKPSGFCPQGFQTVTV